MTHASLTLKSVEMVCTRRSFSRRISRSTPRRCDGVKWAHCSTWEADDFPDSRRWISSVEMKLSGVESGIPGVANVNVDMVLQDASLQAVAASESAHGRVPGHGAGREMRRKFRCAAHPAAFTSATRDPYAYATPGQAPGVISSRIQPEALPANKARACASHCEAPRTPRPRVAHEHMHT